MPIYEYGCKKCGHKFEELVMAGSGPAKCPKCGSAVRDLEGVHDEVCMWCGHRLTTEY